MSYQSTITWLLNSDPAIRWQVMRDLADAEPAAVQAERALVAHTGWGAALLAQQTGEGLWQGDDATRLRTLYCVGLLMDLGADPQDEDVRTALGKAAAVRWVYHDNRPFFTGEVEPCINGKVLAAGSYFGIRCGEILARLLGEQLPDGGWNCEAPENSNRSSFHTTIAVLEGLLQYEKAFGADGDVKAAKARGEEYLLERRLFRRLSTGEVINKAWTRFHYPSTWHYDVLRGLEYFRAAGRHDGRLAEAIDLVLLRRHQNGRWPLNKPYPEDLLQFNMETQIGAASRWITMKAMRVLRWYRAE